MPPPWRYITESHGPPCANTLTPARYLTIRRAVPAESRYAWTSNSVCALGATRGGVAGMEDGDYATRCRAKYLAERAPLQSARAVCQAAPRTARSPVSPRDSGSRSRAVGLRLRGRLA